jgi:hypothetical protein
MQQRRTHWGLLFAAALAISNSLLRWRVHDGLGVRRGLREAEVATRRGVGSGVEPTICSGGRHRCWFRCRRHGPSRQAISSRSSCPGRWHESRTAGAWQDIDKFLAAWAEHQRSAAPFSHQWPARWFRCCHPRPSRQCFVSSPGGSCSTNGRGAYSGAGPFLPERHLDLACGRRFQEWWLARCVRYDSTSSFSVMLNSTSSCGCQSTRPSKYSSRQMI